MSVYNWITLFGIPTIISAVFSFIYSKLNARIKTTSKENKAMKNGIQAILRDRLYQFYKECKAQGYATEFESENFENMYTQYHELGANGVMDNIRKQFRELPIGKDE